VTDGPGGAGTSNGTQNGSVGTQNDGLGNSSNPDIQLAQYAPTVPMGPLPPVYIPGTPQNGAFTRDFIAGMQGLGNAIGSIFNNDEQSQPSARPPQDSQPITNPPQPAPDIPEGWQSSPSRSGGGTVYYPPGQSPNGPESIRVMPPGSSPVPGLENGYWVQTKNNQPINPATGKPGGPGDTHVPLPAPGQ
jgi:hypothetical protein